MKAAVHKWGRSLMHHLVPNVGTVLIVALMLFVYSTWAAPQAPNAGADRLSYQGQLLDSGGTPVNGQVEMTFRIYNVPTGGTALWTEAHTGGNSVPVDNGRFHVLLGSLTPIPSSVWENDDLYLEVQVGSEVLSPREVLVGVPYAVAATMSPGDFTVNGNLTVSQFGAFGTPGEGEGGEIWLMEGASGIRWYMDNFNGQVRWFNIDTEGHTSKETMWLSPGGNLRLAGSLSQVAQAREVVDAPSGGRTTTSSSFEYYGTSSISFSLSDTSLVYVYIRAAMKTDSCSRTGQVALNIDGENHGHEHAQPIYVENFGGWRSIGAGAIVELGPGQHTIRPAFRVVNGDATLTAGELGYGYYILGRK